MNVFSSTGKNCTGSAPSISAVGRSLLWGNWPQEKHFYLVGLAFWGQLWSRSGEIHRPPRLSLFAIFVCLYASVIYQKNNLWRLTNQTKVTFWANMTLLVKPTTFIPAALQIVQSHSYPHLILQMISSQTNVQIIQTLVISMSKTKPWDLAHH